ncbi:MAG: hypothetical protein COA71_11960 [SAR86 cluster bacterium]|uniref:Type II toxin-antitoxin system RelE/ParE family toxin n=1 Tax=SAR86 cluster bacterium TaxID=2030880 RepID=A0A2A5CA22_9GAMM|nr:type II toxin-antitoxin system RelE/ParE family toxin [Gammaproteobacteria bacterium AH-315-E17]PCJ40216.1 MAG: hypothetical protein COA71_11960 [SAR86 cluster bacterium]
MKVISAVFFKLSNDKEPVKDWLLSLDKQDRLIIGQDIKTIELGWPLGMPLVRKMDNSLWEVRCSLKGKRISRVLFTVYRNQMVLLHGFIKKTQKTPVNDLSKAKKRRDLILGGEK